MSLQKNKTDLVLLGGVKKGNDNSSVIWLVFS